MTARSHLNTDGAFLSHRHQPGPGRQPAGCVPCDCLSPGAAPRGSPPGRPGWDTNPFVGQAQAPTQAEQTRGIRTNIPDVLLHTHKGHELGSKGGPRPHPKGWVRPVVIRCTHIVSCRLGSASRAASGRAEEAQHCHHAAQWLVVTQHAHMYLAACILPAGLPVLPSKLITASNGQEDAPVAHSGLVLCVVPTDTHTNNI